MNRNHIKIDYYDNILKHLNEPAGNYFRLVLNSTILFTIAYCILNFGYNFITAITAHFAGFPVIVYYNDILITEYTVIWTKWKVLLVFLSGPVFLLIIAILGKILHNRTRIVDHWLPLFFLWLSFCGLMMFFSQGFNVLLNRDFSSPLYRGFAVLTAWFELNPLFETMTGILLLTGLVITGILHTKSFLRLSFSQRLVRNRIGKLSYFGLVAIVPFFLGMAVQVGLVFPRSVQLILVNMIGGLMVILSSVIYMTTFFGTGAFRNRSLLQLHIPLVIFSLIVIISIRLFADKGIRLFP